MPKNKPVSTLNITLHHCKSLFFFVEYKFYHFLFVEKNLEMQPLSFGV